MNSRLMISLLKRILLIFITVSYIYGMECVMAEFTLLKSEDPTVRSREAARLGDEKVIEAVPELIELLKDKITGPRINAIVALGKIGDPKAIGPLKVIIRNDPVEAAKVMATEALGNFKTVSIDTTLCSAADDKSENIRYSALRSLGSKDGKESMEKIIEKARTEHDVNIRELAYDLIIRAVKEGTLAGKEAKKVIREGIKSKTPGIKDLAKTKYGLLKTVMKKKRK